MSHGIRGLLSRRADVKIYIRKEENRFMGIKISDILLDLGSGDASVHDAYIQEAVGQVNVSAAIFEYACGVADMDDSERETIVQEAAEAGLPSDQDQAVELAYECVSNALCSTFRHIYSESALVQEAFTGSTSPMKAIIAFAKKFGVKDADLTGGKAQAEKIADSICNNRKLVVKGGMKFIKPAAIKQLTTRYINGTSLILNAYCVDTDDLYSDNYPAVKYLVSAPMQIKCTNAAWQLNTVTEAMDKITDMTKYDENKFLDNAYIKDDSIGKNDLATMILCYMAWGQAGDYFKNKLTDQGKAGRERAIKKLVAGAKDAGRTISKPARALLGKAMKADLTDDGPSNMSKVEGPSVAERSSTLEKMNQNFQKLGKTLKKAFNDSLAAVIEKTAEK